MIRLETSLQAVCRLCSLLSSCFILSIPDPKGKEAILSTLDNFFGGLGRVLGVAYSEGTTRHPSCLLCRIVLVLPGIFPLLFHCLFIC